MKKLTKKLDKIFSSVNKNLEKSLLDEEGFRQNVEEICRSISNKAPIRFLMACLLAKLDNPKFDIRKPYTEIGGRDSYSGRFYDETVVQEFISKYSLPCNSTTAFLTPAFRNIDRILKTNLVLVGRPKELYKSTLELLNLVHSGK